MERFLFFLIDVLCGKSDIAISFNYYSRKRERLTYYVIVEASIIEIKNHGLKNASLMRR